MGQNQPIPWAPGADNMQKVQTAVANRLTVERDSIPADIVLQRLQRFFSGIEHLVCQVLTFGLIGITEKIFYPYLVSKKDKINFFI